MNRLRIAVVGCGHLGSIHARLLASLDQVELVAVVDPIVENRQKVAAECGCLPLADHHSLAQLVDAAVVANPTPGHYQVARELLEQNVHLLIEKPITTTVPQAKELIDIAWHRGLVLQVGHVERFNPAWNAVAPSLEQPQYIEAVRAGTYTFRATDVSIVLDLMIHDLDLVLSLAQSHVVEIEAQGVAMFGPHEDLAIAHLRFANGCVANLKASRVNYEPQRTMQIYAAKAYAAINFATGSARLVRPSREVLSGQVDLTDCPAQQRPQIQETMFRNLLCLDDVVVERGNAILEEQREFAAAILQGSSVRVTGEQGCEALAVAQRILDAIANHRWNGLRPDQVGPHALFTPDPLPSRRAA